MAAAGKKSALTKWREGLHKRDESGQFKDKATLTKEKAKAQAPGALERAAGTAAAKEADRAKQDAAQAAEERRISGSATIVREELSGSDNVSKMKRRNAEQAYATVKARAALEGVSMRGLSEAAFFALAKRAGLDPGSAAVIHAALINAVGGTATTALTAQERAEAAAASRGERAKELAGRAAGREASAAVAALERARVFNANKAQAEDEEKRRAKALAAARR